MASYPLCVTHSNQSVFLQNKPPLSIPRPRWLFSTLSSPFSPIRPPFLQNFIRKDMTSSIGKKLPVCSSRRMLNLSLLTVLLSFPLSRFCIAVAEELDLQRYTDSIEGFTLLVPTSWIKVEKAGATVLFEDANKGANNVGVVVSPVRLTNLVEFGTPQFVADKLIQAEKQKESTKEAEVVAFSERSGQGGLQVYEFEYKVDSTRGGMKRIFSAAFVVSKKLYLLNIAHSDKPESPLDAHRRLILEQVLHSFDTA